MSIQQNFQLMAVYNQWMNDKLFELATSLSAADLEKDRGAFFGSVLGTLNHVLAGDIIWLKRFADHPRQFASLQRLSSTPNPESLAQILYSDIAELHRARIEMDMDIIEFVNQATDSDYDHELLYKNTKGKPFCKKFGLLVYHFFNHQTHHRGQLTVLFSQIGLDCGSTDLLAKIPEVE